MKYQTLSCTFYELDKQLEIRAKDGWRVISCTVKSEGFSDTAYVILGKEIPGHER